ncbi:unnamed protein product [Amoebophrya sp. A120]|nr:unnamed protein product [Amoebophrya sp. A120]|eukprot:GSA120T00017251001.1
MPMQSRFERRRKDRARILDICSRIADKVVAESGVEVSLHKKPTAGAVGDGLAVHRHQELHDGIALTFPTSTGGTTDHATSGTSLPHLPPVSAVMVDKERDRTNLSTASPCTTMSSPSSPSSSGTTKDESKNSFWATVPAALNPASELCALQKKTGRAERKQQQLESVITSAVFPVVEHVLQHQASRKILPSNATLRGGAEDVVDTAATEKIIATGSSIQRMKKPSSTTTAPLHIVDFCAGSGHVGLLVAHFFGPDKVQVTCVDRCPGKCEMGNNRAKDAGLTNAKFVRKSLEECGIGRDDDSEIKLKQHETASATTTIEQDVFKFDVALSLHSCGLLTDAILKMCTEQKASFVLVPCCYGQLCGKERLFYSKLFGLDAVPRPQSRFFQNRNWWGEKVFAGTSTTTSALEGTTNDPLKTEDHSADDSMLMCTPATTADESGETTPDPDVESDDDHGSLDAPLHESAKEDDGLSTPRKLLQERNAARSAQQGRTTRDAFRPLIPRNDLDFFRNKIILSQQHNASSIKAKTTSSSRIKAQQLPGGDLADQMKDMNLEEFVRTPPPAPETTAPVVSNAEETSEDASGSGVMMQTTGFQSETSENCLVHENDFWSQILVSAEIDVVGNQSNWQDENFENNLKFQQVKKCMQACDVDRLRRVREKCPDLYDVRLTSLYPLNCTPKNEVLVGKRRFV